MEVLFADQPLVVRHPSLILAGPTPRSSGVASSYLSFRLLRQMGGTGLEPVPPAATPSASNLPTKPLSSPPAAPISASSCFPAGVFIPPCPPFVGCSPTRSRGATPGTSPAPPTW